MKICDMFKLQKRKVTVLGLLLEKTHAQCYSVFATISNKTCCLVKWTELYDIHILHTLEWKCARYSSICRRHFVPAKFRTIPNSTDWIELDMTLWNFRQVYSPKLDLKIKNHSALERFISTHGMLWATELRPSPRYSSQIKKIKILSMDFFERESRPTLTICAPFLWNYRKLLTHATGAIFKARELQNRAGVPNDEKCVDWKRAK